MVEFSRLEAAVWPEANMCVNLPGPVFDAHNPKVLILPGSIGIVASMIFLSFSKGGRQPILFFYTAATDLPTARVLSNPSLIRHMWRNEFFAAV